MDISQINKVMQESCEQYGFSGDNSLEYVGLVIKDNVCSSTKIYRRLSNESDEKELVEKYKNLKFFKGIINFAKIYDFSVRNDGDDKEYIRMVFAPFKSVIDDVCKFEQLLNLCCLNNYKSYFSQLIEYYREIEFTGTSPLLKMGVELDITGKLLEAKAYFALKSYDDRYDTLGKRYRYSQCRKLVDKSLSILKMDCKSEQFLKTAAEMEKNYYFPIFTGVNFSEKYVEMKVYYETCFPDYKNYIIRNYENQLSRMMLSNPEALIELNEKYLEQGLFLDCISYSVIKYTNSCGEEFSTPIWKPYYLLYTNELAKRRAVDYYYYEKLSAPCVNYDDYKQVLLVDENDNPIGTMDKTEAHLVGKRHRAFSVFLHDGKGNMIIQKRAASKYHSPSLWTNACCSHPFTDFIKEEAQLRMKEELGIENVDLHEVFSFSYNEKVGKGLIENEIDHIFVGEYCAAIKVNPEEAEEIKSVPFQELLESVRSKPKIYTVWFRIVIDRVIDYLMKECYKQDEN